jgi:hypothetical protein
MPTDFLVCNKRKREQILPFISIFQLPLQSVWDGQRSQNSVWLRTGRPNNRGSIPGRGERIFPVTSMPRPALGPTQPPVQMGTGGPFPGGKARPRRDADHSPHLVPRSRMSRRYIPLPPSAFVACCGSALVFFNYFSVRVVGTCMTFYQYCPGLITALLLSVAYFHEQSALSPRQKTTITQSDTNVKTPTVGNGDEAQRTSFTFLLQMISPQTSSSAVLELWITLYIGRYDPSKKLNEHFIWMSSTKCVIF